MEWKKLKENWIFILLFAASTIFFIYQHYLSISWDFSVYVMNAKYLFSGGHYFEWYRSPLAPFMISVFSFAGYSAAEYIYVVFVSVLFAVSCMKFSEKAGFDRDIFYALMLSPFLLNAGLSIGTELLTLSLLMLFIAYLKERKSALFLGLAVLSRYTSAIFLPLVLFKKNWKEIIFAILIIALIFSPWAAFNYAEKGHPFYSVASSSALNVVFRDYYSMPPHAVDFIVPMSFCAFLFVPGGYLAWKRKFGEMDWAILIFSVFLVMSYFTVPNKEPRYLFNLILPAAYFSYFAIKEAVKKIDKRLVILILVLLNFSTAFLFFYAPQEPDLIGQAISEADDGCMAMSNGWPYVNYLGLECQPFPAKENVAEEISRGKRIILFKSAREPPYTSNRTFLSRFPKISETNSYVILGNQSICAPKQDVDRSYLESLEERNISFYLHPTLPIVRQ